MPRPIDSSGLATDEIVRRGRAARMAWLSLGLLLVGVGFVGIFVPLLPTTDFLILAVPCFARSSPRLEKWLLQHPRFGPAIRAWREHRAIPGHAKAAACAGIAIGFGLFCLLAHPGRDVAMLVAVPLLASAFWIVSRPATGSPRQ